MMMTMRICLCVLSAEWGSCGYLESNWSPPTFTFIFISIARLQTGHWAYLKKKANLEFSYLHALHNCLRCQIVHGAKLSILHYCAKLSVVKNCLQCQIVHGAKFCVVPNFAWCQIVHFTLRC